jgi:hypothetical protein
MSKNREQSAIDAIYELLDEVAELRKEIKNIDNNIKLLNNKVGKLSQAPQLPQPGPSAIATATAVQVNSQKSSNEPVQTIKLFGRIKNQARKPIKGVYIKIYDPIGNIIKSRETDGEGYWEARVNPGQYVVELDAKHINPKFLPKNINVDVNETMNEFEVK